MHRGKRFLALVVGVLLVFTFIVPAWAEPGGKNSVTANGSAKVKLAAELEGDDEGDDQLPDRDQDREKDQERDRDQERERDQERLNLHQDGSVPEHVYRGVANALLHVKNPVARAALTAILEGESVAEAVYKAKAELPSWQDADEIASVAEQLKNALETDTTLDVTGKLQLKKHIAKMYIKARHFQNARELLEAILAQQPDDEDAYQQLDEICAGAGELQVKVFVKGKGLSFDVMPRIENGRVVIPVRALAEALGAEVKYDNGEVIIQLDDVTIRLVINSNVAIVDGATVNLDVATRVENGRTLVPLRFVSEKFKARVNYYGKSHLVAVQET